MSHVVAIPVVHGEPYTEVDMYNEEFIHTMSVKERKTFITKVYVCVEFQLLLLFGFLFFSRKYELDYFFISDVGQFLFGISLFLLIWCSFASCFCYDIYKSFPIN